MESLYVPKDLNEQVVNRGYLVATPYYYNFVIARTFAILLLAVSMVVLIRYFFSGFLAQIPVATLMAFSFGQFLLLGHEFNHGQADTRRLLAKFAMQFANFIAYSSIGEWYDRHRVHHDRPNDSAHDPDARIRFYAFSRKQAEAKRGIMRSIGKRQAYLFPFFSLFTVINLRVVTVQNLRRRCTKLMIWELIRIFGSIAIVGSCLSLLLGFWYALGFMFITEVALGAYMGHAFIVNHCGRQFNNEGIQSDFVHQQIESSRNVLGSSRWINAFLTFLFGGLNYQIEHHLFSHMSRRHFRGAADIVVAYCRSHDIDYHAVSLCRAYREVYRHLRLMGKFCGS